MMLQQTRNNLLEQEAFAQQAGGASVESILVVDDDPGMRTALLKTLRANGFHCLSAGGGSAMFDTLRDNQVDLVLLDVMMPGANGFDLCRDLRSRDQNPVPIIMISARGEEADRVTGLELGADDYIAKPFGKSELLARIRALLRRSRMRDETAVARARYLRFAGWTLDLGQRDLFTPANVRVDLSGAEYDLLAALLAHPQRVLGRDALLEMSHSRLAHASDRSVDVHICRLRRKLGDDEQREMIRTVRGAGYIFTLPVERL